MIETTDMVTSKAKDRSMGADPMGAEARVGMGVCMVIKGTCPTPPIHNMEKFSAETRHSRTEVGWYNNKERG